MLFMLSAWVRGSRPAVCHDSVKLVECLFVPRHLHSQGYFVSIICLTSAQVYVLPASSSASLSSIHALISSMGLLSALRDCARCHSWFTDKFAFITGCIILWHVIFRYYKLLRQRYAFYRTSGTGSTNFLCICSACALTGYKACWGSPSTVMLR